MEERRHSPFQVLDASAIEGIRGLAGESSSIYSCIQIYKALTPPAPPAYRGAIGREEGGERRNDTSKSTGRSGRQNAATRRNMRREKRVTVQGPVKKQQPDGMSHGGIHCHQPPEAPPPPPPRVHCTGQVLRGIAHPPPPLHTRGPRHSGTLVHKCVGPTPHLNCNVLPPPTKIDPPPPPPPPPEREGQGMRGGGAQWAPPPWDVVFGGRGLRPARWEVPATGVATGP